MTREEKIAKAQELRGGEFPSSIADSARVLGVSKSTILRWTNPSYNKRQLAKARDAKRARTGICSDCGGPTRYGGKSTSNGGVSTRCSSCAQERAAAQKKWTRETVIDAIQRFAEENGRPPTATEWITANPAMGYPPRSSVYGRKKQPFVKWGDAIEAAGFRRPKMGHYDRTRLDPIMLAAARAEGDLA